ncbi:MAG: hypothetical protein WBW84_22030, partial [Acidobacteriaceae bacterium]
RKQRVPDEIDLLNPVATALSGPPCRPLTHSSRDWAVAQSFPKADKTCYFNMLRDIEMYLL